MEASQREVGAHDLGRPGEPCRRRGGHHLVGGGFGLVELAALALEKRQVAAGAEVRQRGRRAAQVACGGQFAPGVFEIAGPERRGTAVAVHGNRDDLRPGQPQPGEDHWIDRHPPVGGELQLEFTRHPGARPGDKVQQHLKAGGAEAGQLARTPGRRVGEQVEVGGPAKHHPRHGQTGRELRMR